jgi:hypothetical protein
VESLDIILTEEELEQLEKPYVPHYPTGF